MRNAFSVWASAFLGAVCVLLVVVAWLGWENLSRPANVVVSPTDETVTLADAIDLLPHSENVAAGRALGNDRYWIWVETTDEKATPLEESWVVDVAAQTAIQISARRFGPGGGVATIGYLANDPTSEYLTVKWTGGWEGIWTTVNEYIRRDTGALAYSLILNSGQSAEIVALDRTIDIAYAPDTLCESVSSERNTAVEQATGLLIDGTVYLFPEQIDIKCSFSDFSGQKLRQEFGSFFIDGNHARLIFPTGHADIPLSLNMDQIIFAGF